MVALLERSESLTSAVDQGWDSLYQAVGDLEGGVPTEGLVTTERLASLCAHVTPWQFVIHGDTREYRQGAVRVLCEQGHWRKAMRFALCGRGDVLCKEVGGDRVKVGCRGCGVRFCPRCSRRSGQRFLRRIGAHLESSGHGEIWHFVLTQVVHGEETVVEARERFKKSWGKWYTALRRAGMRSGLLAEHVKPREAHGWHYHGHCIVEFAEGTDTVAMGKKLEAAWHKATKAWSTGAKELFRRKVCDAGPAVDAGALTAQGELWQESDSAVQRVLQYAIRDIVAGVESWVVKLRTVHEIGKFTEVCSHAKLHRLFGAWRKEAAPVVDVESVRGEGVPGSGTVPADKRGTTVWEHIGNIDRVWREAKAGGQVAQQCLLRLQTGYYNGGLLYRRLTTVLRRFADVRLAG